MGRTLDIVEVAVKEYIRCRDSRILDLPFIGWNWAHGTDRKGIKGR